MVENRSFKEHAREVLAWVSFFSKKDHRVKKQLLDVDAFGGTSEDCANAVDFFMKEVDPPREKKKLDGQMTDAGGGGMGKSF